jgi:hypothetical protein
MLTSDELKENPRKLVSFISLTPDEFDLHLPAFERAYLTKYPTAKTKAGAGRKGSLSCIEQKLLFALVDQKSYPLQSVMGELIGMGQSQANEWIDVLLPILQDALDDLGCAPERDPKEFKQKEQDRKDTAETEKISYPEHIRLHTGAGFQGYELMVKKLFQPEKSRARKN